MTDKVQKIREEVERIQLYTQSEVLKQVLDYIDEVQKEPVSIWHDASEEIPTSGSNILMIRKEEKDTNYPPIAGCFHGTNYRLDGKNWGYYNGFCYHEIEAPYKWAYVDDFLALEEISPKFPLISPKKCMYTKDDFTDEDRKVLCDGCKEECEYAQKEEPVSEDLGGYINELSKQFPEVSFAKLSRIAIRVAKWQMAQMIKDATGAIVAVDASGYPYVDKHIELYDYDKDVPLAKEGDKYKVVLIKEE